MHKIERQNLKLGQCTLQKFAKYLKQYTTENLVHANLSKSPTSDALVGSEHTSDYNLSSDQVLIITNINIPVKN